ncbi:hypothetical protein JCM39194_25150 [Desulfotomaculum varum]|uniref:Uncharacterized protein n=1 Tax=Desulforamulus hydrothermalis Lam5 = DSM 18033 TaxID=1121428 RepID=K8DY14_9FIRM|nr:hypothetical protein [Desulforamulus hydrothermalis]CCO07599.1 conserved hypothetical protein [Desulforamulus hydrothermalis Lam5 = DSM 18033]SHH20198.1 hypothetical protein SAMN02745177_01804 [Desulforamulus hydrothermalis Lam5 = DSM 18033]
MSLDLSLTRQIAALEADVSHLKEWQERQTAALEKLEARLGQILLWLLGLMGGVTASLILLALNLAAGRL